jgi:multiple sugar transport system permease protein
MPSTTDAARLTAPAARSARRRPNVIARRRRRAGLAFVAPVFLFLCAVIVLPLGHAFWTSLHRIRGLNATFVGLGNYERVLGDDAFWHSLEVSLVFTAACVTLHMVLGLALALLLNELTRFRTALRVAFLTPWMVAPAVGATIWLWLLEPQFGVVNYVLQAAGVVDQPVAWLGTPGPALASVIAVDVWRGVPFVMLLLLAGLQTIPQEQYEAASMDGANAWQRFRFVTWPNLRYLVIVASTLDIINVIRHYDIIGVMTGGGPAGASEVLPALLYNTAFRANRFGEAAAVGVALLVLVLAFAIVYVRLTLRDRTEAAS